MTVERIFLAGLRRLAVTFPFLSPIPNPFPFKKRSFTGKEITLPYRILFPKKFDPQKKYAMVLMLHGSGERGINNRMPLICGAHIFLKRTIRANYPAIVIYPQCPKSSFWSNVEIGENNSFTFLESGEPTIAMAGLLELIDQMLNEPYIDKHQVYIGGFSMGGMGALELLRRKPDLFAAGFVISGGDHPANAKKYAMKTPLWISHGTNDAIVPFDFSQIMVDALKAAGADPKFTIYPNDGHGILRKVFDDPKLLPWLFSHKK